MAELILKDKIIEGKPDFLIFFDNVNVTPFVESFNVSLSINGNINTAYIQMIYIPQFYKIVHEQNNVIISEEDGIEDMTNVRIFVKNIFNNRYNLVFDGNIRGRNLTKSRNGYSLSFTAVDYMAWLNKTIAPIAIALNERLAPGDKLKWQGQGIDLKNVKTVVAEKDITFKNKTIKEVIEQVIKQAITSNKIYTDANTVSAFDNATARITLMGDIQENLRRAGVIDFMLQGYTSYVESVYVLLNDIVRNLMFEFYQDRDGVIRIKPPYWNQPVLLDHVIDPLLILNYSEYKNYEAYYTRVIITGGLEEWEINSSELEKRIVTPVGVYTSDNHWADYTTPNVMLKSSNKYGWLTNYPITSNYEEKRGGRRHLGVDFGMPIGTPVRHIGSNGIVTVGYDEDGWGNYVKVKLTDGKYKGHTVIYAHLNQVIVSNGASVNNNDILGYSGNTGNSTGPHLHVEIMDSKGSHIHPLIYLLNINVRYADAELIGVSDLLKPTNDEKKHGISVYYSNQPLIKFSTAVTTGHQTARDALRSYAKFLLHLLNASVETASVQIIAMPWLRPGFNVWVDPISIDKIFYIQSMTIQGSYNTGVFMTLNLSLGRTRYYFLHGGQNKFGTLSSDFDNIFVNKLFDEFKVEKFGKVINTKSSDRYSFDAIRQQMLKFYLSNNSNILSPQNVSHYQLLYSHTNYNSSYGLQKNITTQQASSNKINPNKWPNILKKGQRNIYVGQLQQFLIDYGYLNISKPTNYFGEMTYKAVVRFQKNNGLTVDGIVGPKTKAAIIKLLNQHIIADTSNNNLRNIQVALWPTLKVGDRNKYVEQLQQFLVNFGYLKVKKINNYFSTQVKNAVIQFQKNNGLTVDGIVGPQTKEYIAQLIDANNDQTNNVAMLNKNIYIFSKDYTPAEIQQILNNLYLKTNNQTIKARVQKINNIVKQINDFIAKHYITIKK